MARQARLAVPGHVHHLLIRGNNRQAIFVDDEDRTRFLSCLRDAVCEHKLALNAYVLMPNQVHLAVTPVTPEAMSRAVQSLGRRYVAGHNARHERSGTLWEGRFRANVVVGSPEVIRLMHFIEMSPQRAGLASGLLDFEWSSLAHHLGARADSSITEPAAYWLLGNTPFEREAAYRRGAEQGVPAAQAERIMAALLGGRPLADAAELAALERLTQRTLVRRPRGRPAKAKP
jgi:putative transposase